MIPKNVGRPLQDAPYDLISADRLFLDGEYRRPRLLRSSRQVGGRGPLLPLRHGLWIDPGPKFYGAFLAALKEATEIVSNDKGAAAEAYLRFTKDRSSKEELVSILTDKTTRIHYRRAQPRLLHGVHGQGRPSEKPACRLEKEMLFPEATAQ